MTIAQRTIERSYQRAMDIRDSSPPGTNTPGNEEWYTRMYRRLYKRGDMKAAHEFRRHTRRYLHTLRGLVA
jgi:hypothetical protein